MTKCIAVTLVIISLVALDVKAESNVVGFRGGSNFAKLSTETAGDLESVTGAIAGISGVFELTPWLAFQPELLYGVRGSKGKIELNSRGVTSVEGEVKLKYLELPLLLRIHPPVNWPVIPYVVGGTALAANLSAYATGTAMGLGAPVTDDKIDKLVTDGDLELIIGGGVQIWLRYFRVEASARYTKGLLDVDERVSALTLKNNVWSVMVSLLFDVGGGS
jgi:hypothetical protein